MTKICSNYVREHTTSLWDHYVARISFEVDRHLAVHDLGCTTWSHNIKCRTTHVAHTVHTTTTRFMSHNHVVPSHMTKFLSVWTHLKEMMYPDEQLGSLGIDQVVLPRHGGWRNPLWVVLIAMADKECVFTDFNFLVYDSKFCTPVFFSTSKFIILSICKILHGIKVSSINHQ